MAGAPLLERLDEVSRKLAGRRLYWFGIRGEDAQPLLDIPEFAGSFAITAPLRSIAIPAAQNVALEQSVGHRVDLDRYDLDDDTSEPAIRFRRTLLRAVDEPCVLLTYRPNGFVSSLAYASAHTLSVAGMLKDRQRAFEFKPWVETSLRGKGVAMVDWTYVPDAERSRAKRLLSRLGPLVLRVSRASGGVGMVVAETDDDIDSHWPFQSDSFVAVAPYLEPTIPVNLSGCVFARGSVRLHPVSVQLIGLQSCTPLRFGYCGNDYGAARSLQEGVIAKLEAMGHAVGRWLAEERYLGAFGIDAMVRGDDVLFTEVNARFQGSSSMSALLARQLGAIDIYLDHLAPFLELDPGPERTLAEWMQDQPAMAHVVVHNRSGESRSLVASLGAEAMPSGFLPVQLPEGVEVSPGGVLGRLLVSRSITSDGFAVDRQTEQAISAVAALYATSAMGEEVR